VAKLYKKLLIMPAYHLVCWDIGMLVVVEIQMIPYKCRDAMRASLLTRSFSFLPLP
jgi:hypothetical protein